MKKRNKERGVTLIALVVTIVILSLLACTVAANVDGLTNTKTKTDFEQDISELAEKVEQYYARNKTLPVLNEYTNTSMFIDVKNVNDSDTYWVIDIASLGLDSLNYGADYQTIQAMNDPSADVSQYTDVYIINRGSHTIYYPKGVEYDGAIHYSVEDYYSEANVTINANIVFSRR